MNSFEARLKMLKQLWQSQGFKFGPQITEEEIQAFESYHHVCVPFDLREYFLTLDGMDEKSVDGLTRLWPFHEICLLVEQMGEINSAWLDNLIPDVTSYYIIGDYNFRGSYWA